TSGACGDGTYWGAASFTNPIDIQPIPTAQGGGWLVSDEIDYRVRRLGPDGSVITVAGNGNECAVATPATCHTDAGQATDAELGDSSTAVTNTGATGIGPLSTGGFLIADRSAN